jgi:hypothetical protein
MGSYHDPITQPPLICGSKRSGLVASLSVLGVCAVIAIGLFMFRQRQVKSTHMVERGNGDAAHMDLDLSETPQKMEQENDGAEGRRSLRELIQDSISSFRRSDAGDDQTQRNSDVL